MKPTRKILFPLITLAAVLVSACNAPATATPTAEVNAIYTAAVETITAQAALFTATPQPSATPTVTPTLAATATLEVLPTLITGATSALANYCDNSLYIADVTVPDHTEMAPGQAFDKTWTLKNTGTCTWTVGYTIVSAGGDRMGGNTRPLTQSVPPQGQVDVTVKMTAPFTAGDYVGYWRLVNSKGAGFGQVVSVIIKVVAGATTTTTPATTVTTAPASASATATTTTPPAPAHTPTLTVTPTKTP